MVTESTNASKKPKFDVDWFLRDKLPAFPHTPDRNLNAASSQVDDETLQARLRNQLAAHAQKSDNAKGYNLQRSRSLPENSVHEKRRGFLKWFFPPKREKNVDTLSTHITNNVQPRLEKESPIPSTHDQVHVTPQIRKRSQSISIADLDRRLEIFLNYYKEKGLHQLQKDLEAPNSEESSILSSTQICVSPSNTSQHTDFLGRPIPPHPSRALMPSALVKNSRFENYLNNQRAHLENKTAQYSSKLSFLRRHITNDSQNSKSSSIGSSTRDLKLPSLAATPVPNTASTTETKPVIIPGLENLPNLKVVTFDTPVFFNDPPQQIPSRTPRKGEVEIMLDGSIVIHKLTASEKRHIINSSGGGIVVGGSGPLKIILKEERNVHAEATSEPINSSPVQNQNSDFEEEKEEKHQQKEEEEGEEKEKEKEKVCEEKGVKSADSHFEEQVNDEMKPNNQKYSNETASSVRHQQAPNEQKGAVTNNDEVFVDIEATKINIDKPMTCHKSSASLTSANFKIVEEINIGKAKVPLDVLYTRCCHLREILPIPATLKQLKPGSTDPISVLQLRNPKPSLVEVLTFSDFISIAPILCVSLDGVSLSSEMFRIILSSVTHKKEFEKLTLRNTPIDEMGWKLLCCFLTKNKTISRLDLSQVPSLKLDVQKPSKASLSNIKRMECDPNSRSDMNWNLFNAVLVSRGGIDELVLNGAKMSNQSFKNLIEMGVSLSTTKLGLAYNELTSEQCDVLAKYLNFDMVAGLDLAYNDLAGKLQKFVDTAQTFTALRFISLNSTNLTDTDGEVSHLVGDFLRFKNLSYLDFSNNKMLFPDFMITLSEILPVFPKLKRIHLDDNDLNQEALVLFSKLIPFCKSLSHISLTGNSFNSVSAGALCSALKVSNTVVTVDLDYDKLPPKFCEEIALYTVRNMQTEVYGKTETGTDMKGLQQDLSQLLVSDESNPHHAQLIEGVTTKASDIRTRIHETIDDLFKLRIQGKLSVEGKETLIRFCFIDASIEKGLKLLERKSSAITSELTKEAEHSSAIALKKTEHELDSTPIVRNHSSLNQIPFPFSGEHFNVELLPFGVSHSLSTHEHPETEEIKDDGRARAKDINHIKEEASMLKLSNLIRSDMERTLSEERIQKVKDLSQDISGEKFREILLKSGDLNNVIETLDSLKKNGILLKDIYQKQDHYDDRDDGLFSEKLKSGSITRSLESNDSATICKHNPDDVSDTASGAESEDEGLDQAYDEILDHLVRVRTAG